MTKEFIPAIISNDINAHPMNETPPFPFEFFRPKEGEVHRVRLVPPTDESALPYKQIFEHWVKKPQGGIRRVPCTLNESPCLVCESYETTQNRELKRHAKYVYSVIDRDQPKKDGRPLVKPWIAPYSVHRQIIKLFLDPPVVPEKQRSLFGKVAHFLMVMLLTLVGRKPKDPGPRDLTDPLNGVDLRIKQEGSGFQTSYGISLAGVEPTPLTKSEKEFEEIARQAAHQREHIE